MLRPLRSLAAPRERRESAPRPAHSVWGGRRARAGGPGNRTTGVRTLECPPRRLCPRTWFRDQCTCTVSAQASCWVAFLTPAFWGSRHRRPLQTLLLSTFKLEHHSEPLRERRCPLRPPAWPCLGCRVRGGGNRQTPCARPQPLRSSSASPVTSGPEGSLGSCTASPVLGACRQEGAGRREPGPGLGGRHRGPRLRAIWTPSAGAFEVVRGGSLFARPLWLGAWRWFTALMPLNLFPGDPGSIRPGPEPGCQASRVIKGGWVLLLKLNSGPAERSASAAPPPPGGPRPPR